MNTHTISCRIQSQTGALERFLRVVRVRGFELIDMSMQQQSQCYQTTLTLVGHRAIENLLAHLNKLVEVEDIAIAESEYGDIANSAELERCA